MNLSKVTDTIYKLTETNGKEHAEVILLYLFPGIYLGFNFINMHHIIGTSSDTTAASNIDSLRINYCFEGRCEVKLKDGRYVYVDNDVLCIEDHTPQYNFYYPLGFYKGIEIHIDKKMFSDKSPEIFDLFGISPIKLIEKYGNKDCIDYINWKQGFYDDVLSGKTKYYSNLINTEE